MRNCKCQSRLQLHVFNATATSEGFCVLSRKGWICISATRCATATANPDCNCMSSTRLQLGTDYVFCRGKGEYTYLPLGAQLQVSTPTATTCLQHDYNLGQILCFVRGRGEFAYLPLDTQLQVLPPTVTACLQRNCNLGSKIFYFIFLPPCHMKAKFEEYIFYKLGTSCISTPSCVTTRTCYCNKHTTHN